MKLQDFLRSHRTQIAEKWLGRAIESYPEQAQKFFSSQENEFANPVGSSISQGLDGLFDLLVEGREIEAVQAQAFLDRVIRIRAVQDLTPAEAIGFVFQIKQVIRDELPGTMRDAEILEDLLTFDARVDKLALQSFNIYMQCREKIYELRAKEIRDRTSRIVQRACQVWEAGGSRSRRPDEVE
jgi:hypothetical protein